MYEIPAHLKLSDHELSRLRNRLEEDIRKALVDHDRRMQNYVRWYRAFRNRTEAPPPHKRRHPNYRVPLTQWSAFGKWSQEMQAIYGAGLEIHAEPVGEGDLHRARKVGLFARYRLINYMKILPDLCVFDLRRLLFGRAFAYRPWRRETYPVKAPDGKISEQLAYDGPGFFPLFPDDIVIPAEEGTVQTYSFVCRRYRVTPQQLLDGERKGLYFNITDSTGKKFEEIINQARNGNSRRDDGLKLTSEQDRAEGVVYDGSEVGSGGVLRVWESYHRWRLPKSKRATAEHNLQGRDLDEVDLVTKYLPDLNRIVGVQRLIDHYPTMQAKRPFYDSKLVHDGSQWPMGLGEMLEKIEIELSNNHNLGARGMQLAVGPVIFYTGDSGFDAQNFEYEPGSTYEVANAKGVQAVEFRSDLSGVITREQSLMSHAEKISGQNDLTAGRDMNRPTAPRTATMGVALLQQGEIRADLDVLTFSADAERLIDEFWQLEQCFGDEQTFFRVTEEESGGLFPVQKGGAWLEQPDRDGRYDFKIKFAQSKWTKQAAAERLTQLYELLMANPLAMTAPQLVAEATRELCRALGFPELAKLVPAPPMQDMPREPRDEWAAMQAGDDVDPHEMDDDNEHLRQHAAQLEQAMTQEPERQDPDAIAKLKVHIQLTIEQQQQKRLMHVLATSIAQQMTQQKLGMPGAPGIAGQMPALQTALAAINPAGVGADGQQQQSGGGGGFGGPGAGAGGGARPMGGGSPGGILG